MENAPSGDSPSVDSPSVDSPSLRQIQSPPARGASKRKPVLNIERSLKSDNRYQYEVGTLDRCMRILFWCKKSERKKMEQSLIGRYEQYRVKFSALN